METLAIAALVGGIAFLIGIAQGREDSDSQWSQWAFKGFLGRAPDGRKYPRHTVLRDILMEERDND
jgi:hypothetical protein